jgi:opacity protein-like surface antigen
MINLNGNNNMKFNFIAVIAAMLISGAASAQHVNIGIKGGVNLYNIHNDNGTKYDMKVGYNIGLLGHIHLGSQFAMQPELVFSTQGAKYKIANTNAELNLNYINIPLLFQYMFDNGFRLEAGPQLGFLVSAKSKVGNTSTDIKNNFNAVDIGLGVGMSYVNPPSGFGFDIRYNVGLNDISENSSVKTSNRGAQIGVFYLFSNRS